MKHLIAPVLGLVVATVGVLALSAPELTVFATEPTSAATSALTTPLAEPSTIKAAISITPTAADSETAVVSATLTPTSTAESTVEPITATEPSVTLTPTLESTPTPESSPTPTPTWTPTSSPTPKPTPRYNLPLDAHVLSIDALRARTYGGGTIQVTRVLSQEQYFKRELFEYPSDGLKITGTMFVPNGIGPFPVIVLDHGYFKPSEYKTGDGTTPAAAVFAQNGYLTLAPDYRCYGGSQCGSDPFYIGYAIDVLNLINELPSLSNADTTRVGIWGHSMGGGITIRVITVDRSIKVASLYGALSSDDEVHYCWLYGCQTPLVTPVPQNANGTSEFDPDYFRGVASPVPDTSPSAPDYKAKLHEIFLQSSPSHFLSYIDTPVIIHHGESDKIVPIDWSVGLTDDLTALGKKATLYTYPGQGHVFSGWGWQLFMSRTVNFFNQYLNPRVTPITVGKRVLQQERIAEQGAY